MLRDNHVKDMHLIHVYTFLHIISAATGMKLLFESRDTEKLYYESTVRSTKAATLNIPQNPLTNTYMPLSKDQQHLSIDQHDVKPTNRPTGMNSGYRKPHIYFPDKYLSFEPIKSFPKSLSFKDRLSPLSHNKDVVMVTQAYASNKETVPRPVLYKLGFMMHPHSVANTDERRFTKTSLDTRKGKKGMDHLILIVTTSFVASLFVIGIATLLFLVRRKRQNTPKEITLPSEGWNKTNIGSASKEASHLQRAGLSSYELSRTLSAVPSYPLTECPQPSGVGQVILQRCNSTYSTHLNPNSKFINQFSDFVGGNGGRISSPQSDVTLDVPPGAVTEGDIQQVFINVSLEGEAFEVCSDDNDIQLSPVVELMTPSKHHWEESVILSLPHRANLKDNSWNIQVKKTAINSDNESNSLGNWVTLDPAFFSCDEEFVRIKTQESGLYVVVGNGGKSSEESLHVCAEAWVNYTATQINYRLYVHQEIQDFHKRICEMEQVYNGHPLSAPVPLTIHRHSPDLKVVLEVCSPSLDAMPITKPISTELCYQCYSSPTQVELHQVTSLHAATSTKLSVLGPKGKVTRIPYFHGEIC